MIALCAIADYQIVNGKYQNTSLRLFLFYSHHSFSKTMDGC